MAAADTAIKAMLRRDVYRHRRVMDVMDKAEAVVTRLFARYVDDPNAMPEPWRPAASADASATARQIADFLAGMTDRYAVNAYVELFGETPDLG